MHLFRLLVFFMIALYVDSLHVQHRAPRDASTSLFFLHIPKCAGLSFSVDAKHYLPHLEYGEACYEDHNEQRMITMLRNPRLHVLSQYFHCRTSPDHKFGHDFMPVTFPDWIDSWSTHLDEFEHFSSQPFCCYTPYNLMSARFTCGRGISEEAAHFHPASKQKLADKIANLTFVGLVEAYAESLCLLRIQETEEFPEECSCSDHVSSGTSQTHKTHGSKRHSIGDYGEDVLKKVDKLTALDREIYELGKTRFFNDIRAAEQKYKKKILCRTLDFSALALTNVTKHEENFHSGVQSCNAWEQESKQLRFPF